MKKFNVAGASFRTEKIEFILEKYYTDRSEQDNDSYFVSNQLCLASLNYKFWQYKIQVPVQQHYFIRAFSSYLCQI